MAFSFLIFGTGGLSAARSSGVLPLHFLLKIPSKTSLKWCKSNVIDVWKNIFFMITPLIWRLHGKYLLLNSNLR